ncbi:MAG: transcription antitermination protein NusB, partial [Erysipelotrichaceae bacterium]|nr:transcription antitermination protein NusB [Erysipelotrichaceae bacterium]
VDYIYEISKYLKKWSFDRLNLVEQAILLETVSEIKTGVNDSAVAIDEAITLAKQYCDEDSYKFINGVLDNICKNSQ